jgi:hypothetical protein
MELTGVGVWSSQLRCGDPSESADAAAELDELGFAPLWRPTSGPFPASNGAELPWPAKMTARFSARRS